MTAAQGVVNYGFGYGVVSTTLSLLAYLGVVFGGLSVIPEDSTVMLAACLIHFVPYYLTDSFYHRGSVPILSTTPKLVTFARYTTGILVVCLVVLIVAFWVAVRQRAEAPQVLLLNLFIVSMFLTTGWSMVWSYGLGDAYLPVWVRRLSRFPFGYKPSRGREDRRRRGKVRRP